MNPNSQNQLKQMVTNSDGSVTMILKSDVVAWGIDLRVFIPAVVVLLVLGVLLFRFLKGVRR